MTRMMRGHTYSCGCCHSYGRGKERDRRDDDREAQAEIKAGLDDIDLIALESTVYADAAHVTHLVLEGMTAEADRYSQQPEVQARIRRWKDQKR